MMLSLSSFLLLILACIVAAILYNTYREIKKIQRDNVNIKEISAP